MWHCKIRSLAGVPVDPQVRVTHLVKMAREVCGLILEVEQRQPAKPAAVVGKFPWDQPAVKPVEVGSDE